MRQISNQEDDFSLATRQQTMEERSQTPEWGQLENKVHPPFGAATDKLSSVRVFHMSYDAEL